MNLKYDPQVNAAYLSLTTLTSGAVKKTYSCDPIEVDGMINLDFDDEGRLVGIEVLDASHMLPKSLLPAKAK